MSMNVTRLTSGLAVVTDEMPHLQSASLGVWVGSGSRDERPDEHREDLLRRRDEHFHQCARIDAAFIRAMPVKPPSDLRFDFLNLRRRDFLA